MSNLNGVEPVAIFLKDYPTGEPSTDQFETRSIPEPDVPDGSVLLRTVWMSVDPYMRGRMRQNVKSYIPPFSLEEPLDGGAVSEVVASKSDAFAPGDYVVGFGGWKSVHVADAATLTKVDPNIAPLSAYLGVLGMPGLTAWSGLTQICQPKEGETLFVSGAAGAVGSLVCQLGKQRGLHVIGSAGSAEKCAWLEEEGGCDVAINYKDYAGVGALTKALAEAAPKGVDCYFENVGGDHLEAALNVISFGGRMALCGMIAVYNATTPPPGPTNLVNMIGRGVMAQGFIVSNYRHLTNDFIAEVGPLVASGKVKFRESVYDGLEKAPDAFVGLFHGENFGKAVVRVGPDRVG
ncbi:MAG: NADP-dependent oxidoreductase [Pseudomonadota bacterium]